MNKIGQLFVMGFEGTEYNDYIDNLITNYNIGGVIFFKRNITDSHDQFKSLVLEITKKYESLNLPAPLLMIDHEGGRVHRLKGTSTHFPAPGNMSHLTPDQIYEVYEQQALELKYYGLNMLLGPVLDLCPSVGTKSHIADRSFGTKIEDVVQKAEMAIKAFHDNGLLTVPKHFPGYGEAEIDPHYALPSNNHTLEELEKSYLAPFEQIFQKDCQCVMTAHILSKAVDPEYTATLSSIWMNYLETKMNFQGAIMSDDLCMKSIWDRFPPETFVEKAILAGLNIFLICHMSGEFEGSFERSYEGLKKVIDNNPLASEKAEKSFQKMQSLQKFYQGFKAHDDFSIFEKGQDLLKRYFN